MTEILPGFDEVYEIFKEAASISLETREAAIARWEANRSSYERGDETSLEKLKSKRLRHQLLTRLRDELDNLNANYDPKTETISHPNTIFAVDQQLIRTYAQYQEPSVFENFEFFHNEFDSKNADEIKQRRAYMLSLYSTIFRSGNMVLLGVDRSLLLDSIVYFRSQFEKNEVSDLERRIGSLEEVCKELEEVKERRKEFGETVVLDTAFDQLIDSKSFSEVYEHMIPARINAALRMGTWHNLFSAVQNKRANMLDRSKSKEQRKLLELRWERFGKIMRTVELDGVFMSNLRHDLERCVESYNVVSSFEKDELGNRIPQLRPNQIRKLVDLSIEIHVCNAALDISELECEIKYISPSRYLYDFKNGMGSGINLPLVHPRVFNAYTEKRQYDVVRRLTQAVFSQKSGFAGIAQQDNLITVKELDAIEGSAARAKLRAFRTYSAFGTNTEDVLRGFSEAISRSSADLAQRTGCTGGTVRNSSSDNSEICNRVSKIADIADQLVAFFSNGTVGKTSSDDPETIRDLQEKVQEAASGDEQKSDDPYSALIALVKEPSHQERAPRIAVRIVLDKKNVRLKRLICLPVTGSYRYNFSIPNCGGLLDDMLYNIDGSLRASEGQLDQSFKSISINRFLEQVYQCVKAESSQDCPSPLRDALLNFVKAVHASSYREWKLADYLCDEALADIQQLNGANNRLDEIQVQMLSGEVYYLKHMALRGLADRIWRGKRKLKSLNFAAIQLGYSLEAFSQAYRDKATDSGAMTFRIPMAFMAICFEVLTLKRELEPAISEVNDGVLTTTAHFQDDCWGCSELNGLSLNAVWSDPKRGYEAIKHSLKNLSNEAVKNYEDALEVEDPDQRDEHLWAFRWMRVLSMKSLFVLASKIETIPVGYPTDNVDELTRNLDRSLDLYEDFLGELPDESGAVLGENMVSSFSAAPFSRILWGALDAISTRTPYGRIGNYFFMLDNESRLDPSGLPSRISRRLRSYLVSGGDETRQTTMIKVLKSEMLRMEELVASDSN